MHRLKQLLDGDSARVGAVLGTTITADIAQLNAWLLLAINLISLFYLCRKVIHQHQLHQQKKKL